MVTYHNLLYQADTWDRPRRVVSKIEWHAGELFARVGFIVTNRTDHGVSAGTGAPSRVVASSAARTRPIDPHDWWQYLSFLAFAAWCAGF